MAEVQNGNGYASAGFWVSLAMVVFTVVGAIIWVGGIANEVAANGKAIEDQDRRVERLAADLSRNDLETSGITRDLKEIETQFCASDIVRNLMHANDLRTVSLLWQKVYGVPFPTSNAYYPTICNRAVTAQ